ncbi:hypothetical protein QBC43DRAFT_355411 [Cladorrhinum sp. PSN259]|nr:hypothetical protein QBC43DRAFT_355411 [Cladorrhinum sp. PSN259]
MQISSITLALAALFAAAQAAPAFAPTGKQAERCGPSSFINETSGGSPLVSDCTMLMARFLGEETWTFDGGHNTVAEYGTCKFVVNNFKSPWSYHLGNDDVREILVESINSFKSDDSDPGLPPARVGATGYMNCGGPDIRWYIQHTGKNSP